MPGKFALAISLLLQYQPSFVNEFTVLTKRSFEYVDTETFPGKSLSTALTISIKQETNHCVTASQAKLPMSCSNCDCPFQEIRAAENPFSPVDFQCMLDDSVQRVSFDHGEVLFMQGEPSTCLYAISDGTVKICSHSSDGHEQIVGLSSPQSLLVGLQSISDERYAYTAIATTAVTACKIHHRTLLERVQHDGDLALRLIRAMNAQLAHSRSLTEVLGHNCAAAKVASFILLMTAKSTNGNGSYAFPFSRLEIANFLGLSEETVCRLMANMKREGAVNAPRGRVEIRDWDRLHAIADGVVKLKIIQ